MAYSLTIAGYEFDNPPEKYRKHLTLGNTPVPHYKKSLASFYQSDQQEIQLEVEGRLSLNEQSDLDELERLQQIAIDGGEVEVQFDPFFTGNCIIEDDPFRQSDELGRYRFIMTVNSVDTDDTAYPAHATPTTGNTFTLGSFDFGYDPESVEENYERQTNTVDRLQGISQSVDTAGLVTKVTIDGNTDGAGQAALWNKARNNELSYLEAEFQNGWALIADLSVQNNENAPDYLKGLFRYSVDLLIVSNPDGGIGEVSTYIDHAVKDLGTYVADGDAGSTEIDGLNVEIETGTGSLNGGYVSWPTTTVTLQANATNYVFVTDDDGDGEGVVSVNQSAFPADSIPLWEFVTDSDSITDSTDHRDKLIGEKDTSGSDLVFSTDFVIDDSAFEFARVLALADALDLSPSAVWKGIATLSDSIPDIDDTALLPAKGIAPLSETLDVDDGGTASAGAGGSTVELTTNVTLNGGTVDVTVYEDTDTDGTAENTQTVNGVADGENTTTLDNLDGGSGNDYWVDITPSTTDPTSSPTVNSVVVEQTGGGDPDQNPNTTWTIKGGRYDTSGNEYEGGGIVTRYGG